MIAASSSRSWRAWTIVPVALAATVSWSVPGSADAQGNPEGVTAVWRALPEEHAIDVEIEYESVVDSDDPAGGAVETLPATAVDVTAATSTGRPLDVVPLTAAGDFTVWLVVFDPPAQAGETVGWTLRYRIPSDPADAVVHAFVDDAVVWVSTQTVGEGVSGGPVRQIVEIPADFQLPDTSGAGVVERVEGRWRAWRTTLGPAAPFTVAAENPAGRPAHIGIDGTPVELVALPSDPDWWRRQVDDLMALLTELEAVFDRPLPMERVEVVEVVDAMVRRPVVSVGPDRAEARVVLSPTAPSAEVAHLLAHLWLQDLPRVEPWFKEGLARATGAEAGREAGLLGATDLPAIADLAPDGDPLVEWAPSEPERPRPDLSEVDAYAVDAAYVVIDDVLAEIGVERFREVLTVLEERTITYPAGDFPESQPLAADFRTTLDAFTEIGGSARAEDHYASYVLGDDLLSLLADRADARLSWVELQDRADGWDMPRALRRPMAGWQFDTAAEVATEVSVALDRRDEILELAAGVGLTVPEPVQAAFERLDADHRDELVAVLEERIDHIERVAAAVEAVGGGRGLLADLGLWGEDPEADLENVVDLWNEGSTASAATAADELVELVDGAAGRGTVRILVPVLAIGLLVAAGVGFRRRFEDSGADELEAGTVRIEQEEPR